MRIARYPEGANDLTEWIVNKGATVADLQQAIESAVPLAAAQPAAQASEWEAPVPFLANELSIFPIEALPDTIAPFVSEVAENIQVPVDMAAMTALPCIAAAVSRFCVVRIGADHIEPTNLYAAVVMESGSRKSATLSLLTAPIREVEREWTEREAPKIAMAENEREIHKKRVADIREQLSKRIASGKALELRSELASLTSDPVAEAVPPRVLVDDVTPEELARLMAPRDGLMAMLSAEGGIFGTLAGRYSQKGEANLDLFLKSFDAEPYRVDRVGRTPLMIDRCTLTMGLAVQPDVLQSLGANASFRGRGLLGRFLFSVPRSLVGQRLSQPERCIDPAARCFYHATIRRLFDLAAQGTMRTITFTDDARALHYQYADDIESRQADGCDLSGIRDWASKLAGRVARICANLHMARYASEPEPWNIPIDEETTHAGWAIGGYCVEHALAAFLQMGADIHAGTARDMIAWMVQDGRGDFSERDCFKKYKAKQTADVKAALEVLVERGFLREYQPPANGGRPPGKHYLVHPSAGIYLGRSSK
ncbi:MAG: YfjI family protein [Capsulimonadaceae bacterium]|nr:YfjI family protein [Capsulimonadaceae bacterium]